MVVNISAMKSRDYKTVKEDIEAVVAIKQFQNDVTVKVIIETGYLNMEEKNCCLQNFQRSWRRLRKNFSRRCGKSHSSRY